jgi:hypothetical protein
MEDLVLISKLKKIVNERHQDVVTTMVSGGVDNMEKYNYMLGQIRTYQYLSQEISNLLDKKEHYDTKGTIIDIKGTPKNKPTK